MTLFYLTLHRNLRVELTREVPRDMCWSCRIPTYLHSPSEFILAATFHPRISYRLPSSPCVYEYRSVMNALTAHIAAAEPDAALQAAWQLACQGNQEHLLRLLPIVMLSETVLNVEIAARWLWWSIGIQVGWVLSEDEWWQACVDVAFLADAEASPARDSVPSAASADATTATEGTAIFPTDIQIPNTLPPLLQLGQFCISLLGQRDPFLYPHVALWLARRPTDPMWTYACQDPAEACIVLAGFPRLSVPLFPTRALPPSSSHSLLLHSNVH